MKTDHAFKWYAMSYQVELVEKKDPLIQLETSKTSIKNLFNDLLDKTKVFKYQITVARLWNWIFSSSFQFNNKSSDKS